MDYPVPPPKSRIRLEAGADQIVLRWYRFAIGKYEIGILMHRIMLALFLLFMVPGVCFVLIKGDWSHVTFNSFCWLMGMLLSIFFTARSLIYRASAVAAFKEPEPVEEALLLSHTSLTHSTDDVKSRYQALGDWFSGKEEVGEKVPPRKVLKTYIQRIVFERATLMVMLPTGYFTVGNSLPVEDRAWLAEFLQQWHNAE